MRVTNKLLTENVTRNLLKNTEELYDLQEKASSQKRINRPSDDPLGAGRILDYRKTLCSIEQYERNIGEGESWLKLTDSSLGSVDNALIRAKEVAVAQSTGTANERSRDAAAEEIKTIREEVLQLANTKSEGRYIFAGHQTDTSPFSPDGTYNGDQGEINIKVGGSEEIAINIDGEKVFQDGADIFGILEDLQNGLEADDITQVSQQIESLDDALDQVLEARAEVGGRLNRVESTKSHWSKVRSNVTEMLSETEDADIAKVMSDLMNRETVFQASLATAARVIEPSLIDFLR